MKEARTAALAAAAPEADQDPPRLPVPEISSEGLNLKVAMDLLEQMHDIRRPLAVGTVFKDPSMEFALRNFQVYTTARNCSTSGPPSATRPGTFSASRKSSRPTIFTSKNLASHNI